MPDETYYDILEVSPDAMQKEIREAYRLIASVWHPDRFGQGSKQWARANEKLKEINAAYEVLKDPQKRAEYDRLLGQQGRHAEEEAQRKREAEERAAGERRRQEAEEEARRRRDAEERAAEERQRRGAEESRRRAQEETRRKREEEERRRTAINGWAIWALVFALLAFFFPALRLWAGSAAVVCGIVGWRRAEAFAGRGRWMAGSALGVGGAMALLVLMPVAASWMTAKNAKRGDTWANPVDGATMVFVPAGEFTMGSNDGDEDEKPQHRVSLDGYWIYKHEVTVAQFHKFCQATGRQEPPPPDWGWKDNHPIVNVTWHDATAYAQWAGVRLPTEAEWEKAARGTDGRKYPWGNEWDASKCNNWESGPKRTMAVGSYPQGASPFGAHDMAGNVWEWCSSLKKPYPYRANDGREKENLSANEYPALRGGSWNSDDDLCRAAARNGSAPASGYTNLGFRCAQSR